MHGTNRNRNPEKGEHTNTIFHGKKRVRVVGESIINGTFSRHHGWIWSHHGPTDEGPRTN